MERSGGGGPFGFTVAGGEKGASTFTSSDSSSHSASIPLPPLPPGASLRSFGLALDQSVTEETGGPLLLLGLPPAEGVRAKLKGFLLPLSTLED